MCIRIKQNTCIRWEVKVRKDVCIQAVKLQVMHNYKSVHKRHVTQKHTTCNIYTQVMNHST